ncbi:MAG: IS66 family insertion sequence element accessory protein TnpB [Paracoccaceae bacterium]
MDHVGLDFSGFDQIGGKRCFNLSSLTVAAVYRKAARSSEVGRMISLANSFKIYIANSPVDFRKGMDGLAAIVVNEFDLDPFDGAIFVFRSKRADRLKIIVWDGTGLVLVHIVGVFGWSSGEER